MEETDVYQFVDEEEECDPLVNSGNNNHKQYIRRSLGKEWNKRFVDRSEEIGKKQKEFKIEITIKKWRNTQIVSMNYKQFVNHYRNLLKTYYSFLPLSQINQMVRHFWNKFKAKYNSRHNSSHTSSHNSRHNSTDETTKQFTQNTSKGLLKSKNTRKSDNKKRVSFNLTDSRLQSQSTKTKDKKSEPKVYSVTKSKNKQRVSRFVKPLDISYGSPQSKPNSDKQLEKRFDQKMTHLKTKFIEKRVVDSDSEQLLEYSPQSRGLSIESRDRLSDESDRRSDESNDNLKDIYSPIKTINSFENIKNYGHNRGLSPEKGRNSDFRFADKPLEPFVNLEGSPQIPASDSEPLLERSPLMRGLSPNLSPILSPESLSPEKLSPEKLSPEKLSPERLSSERLSPERDLNLKRNNPKDNSLRESDSLCSPVLTELNSTKSFKRNENNSWISVKKKSNKKMNINSIDKIRCSKKVLFKSPVRNVIEKWAPKRDKLSIPCDVLALVITKREDSPKERDPLCDLFEADISQDNTELSLNSEPLIQ